MEKVNEDADAAVNQFFKSDGMSPPEYAQELWSKELNCGTVYDEARLKVILIEGLQESISQSVRNY